jgi:hypothetical protein
MFGSQPPVGARAANPSNVCDIVNAVGKDQRAFDNKDGTDDNDNGESYDPSLKIVDVNIIERNRNGVTDEYERQAAA